MPVRRQVLQRLGGVTLLGSASLSGCIGDGDSEENAVSQSLAADQPMYGGGPDGTGDRSHLSGIARDWGKRVWEKTPIAISGGFALVDEQLYVPGVDGELVSLDARTGDQEWKATLPGTDVHTPAVVDGIAVGVTTDGAVAAFDAETGEREWRAAVGEDAVAPIIADGRVYVADDPGLTALDLSSGEELASFEPNDKSAGTPAVVDGAVYYNTILGLYRLSGDDLTPEWQLDARTAAQPAVVDGTVFAAGQIENDDGTILTAFDAESGSPLWQAPKPEAVGDGYINTDAGIAVDDDRVYLGTSTGLFMAVSRSEQDVTWMDDYGSSLDTKPMVGKDAVYAMSTSLTALDRTDGTELSSTDAEQSGPLVFTDGVAFVQAWRDRISVAERRA